MVQVDEQKLTLFVVKRNGKKVDFDGTKIALAIKKGFDSVKPKVDEEEESTEKVYTYTEKDIQKVYHSVMKRIQKEYKDKERIKIEEIQDMIEEELKKKGYDDVYTSFSEYRERRNQSDNYSLMRKKHISF